MKVFSCSQRRVYYRNIEGSSCCSYCLILLLLLLSFVDFFVRTFLESSCQEQILHLTKNLEVGFFSDLLYWWVTVWMNMTEWMKTKSERGSMKSGSLFSEHGKTRLIELSKSGTLNLSFACQDILYNLSYKYVQENCLLAPFTFTR